MLLYKGAGPGTHWWLNNPKKSGFSAGRGLVNLHSIVRHIVNYSWPSRFTSFSASFAVACEYALSGPSGRATQAAPGYVYEVDTSVAPRRLAFVDAAREILKANPRLPGLLQTHHDGGQDLVSGIAGGLPQVLTVAPRRPTSSGVAAGPASASGGPPVVTSALRALVFAIRDAEVLAQSRVPRGCIINRYLVY